MADHALSNGFQSDLRSDTWGFGAPWIDTASAEQPIRGVARRNG